MYKSMYKHWQAKIFSLPKPAQTLWQRCVEEDDRKQTWWQRWAEDVLQKMTEHETIKKGELGNLKAENFAEEAVFPMMTIKNNLQISFDSFIWSLSFFDITFNEKASQIFFVQEWIVVVHYFAPVKSKRFELFITLHLLNHTNFSRLSLCTCQITLILVVYHFAFVKFH